ncbi:MAG: hypothetical protein J6Y28_04155 [Acholeplasmatales bacterium]|nr:hypothetical protein [Methanobrevibacter sp.]MBP5445346.1 hypothetical protein [Acholeplasmatales bacterium]
MASGVILRDVNSMEISSTLYDLSNVTTEPVDIILSVNRSAFNWFVIALSTASTNPSSSRGILIVPNAGLTAGAYYYVAVGGA